MYLNKTQGVIVSVAIGSLMVAILYFAWINTPDSPTENAMVSGETVEKSDEVNPYISDEDVIYATNEILSIFYSLYWVTQSDELEQLSDSTLLSTLNEIMEDRNDLERLIHKTRELVNQEHPIVNTTAIGLLTGLMQLEQSHRAYRDYLRDVDANYEDLAEFQYQTAQFLSTNKEAFFTIVEGTSLYPYVFIEFATDEEELGQMRISEDTRVALVAEIDRLFADVFLEEDKWNEETGNRNAVLLIVRNYREDLIALGDLAE